MGQGLVTPIAHFLFSSSSFFPYTENSREYTKGRWYTPFFTKAGQTTDAQDTRRHGPIKYRHEIDDRDRNKPKVTTQGKRMRLTLAMASPMRSTPPPVETETILIFSSLVCDKLDQDIYKAHVEPPDQSRLASATKRNFSSVSVVPGNNLDEWKVAVLDKGFSKFLC